MDVSNRLLTFIVIACLVILGSAYRYRDVCTSEVKLGKVVDVTVSPSELKHGYPAYATIRIETPFRPTATWYLIEGAQDNARQDNDDLNIVTYAVPETNQGIMGAESKVESPGRYSFSLRLDAYQSTVKIRLSVQLHHPCNSIEFYGPISAWKNLAGEDLPTALSVPKPLIDISSGWPARMKVGIKVNYDITEISYSTYFYRNFRKGDELLTRNSRGSRDPVSLSWQTPSGEQWEQADFQGENVEGVLVISKRLRKEDSGIQAVTLVLECGLVFNTTGRLRIRAKTQILLTNFQPVPAIGLDTYQYNSKLVRINPYEKERFRDSDGTILLPLFLGGNISLPFVFECWAEGGEQTPYLAVTRVNRNENGLNDVRVLEAVTSYEIPGIVSKTYHAPLVKSDFICSAATGDKVTNTSFRVYPIMPVRTTTQNASPVKLNEDTFTNGFRINCRSEGEPTPTIRFYQESQFFMHHKPYFSGYTDRTDWLDEGTDDRFSIVNGDKEASLIVSPGQSPFPNEEAFRIVCLGANMFTGDTAYVDFVGM